MTVARRCFLLLILFGALVPASQGDELGVDGYADSNGVRIHYVTAGEGPLVVMIHGFPDFWYTWREQIPTLSQNFQTVAIDQRGYNLSDQPENVSDYALFLLVEDVKAVIDHLDREKAVIVGHDWGGAVAWAFAAIHPEMTDRLVILNLPHPNGLRRELAENPEQQKASAYARRFQEEDAAADLTAEGLASWVKDESARKKYVEAIRRSSFAGMLNYYKANYPRPPFNNATPPMPMVQCPTLVIHGLDDTALLPGALNDTWQWIDNELTLVTIPRAGHFVQQDASESVTRTINTWLLHGPGSAR